jgi:CHAD domain-containing protein
MGERDAMRKQQNISRASERAAGAPEAGADARARAESGGEPRLTRLLDLAANFDGILDQGSASPRAVHQLRTGSRRIQATIETMLREDGASIASLEKPAQRWLRELKRLRRKAAPVRDLDVHRKLLKKPLADSIKRFAATEEGSRAAGDRLRGLAARFDDWLKDQRCARAGPFKECLKKRGPKLKARARAFLAAGDRLHELSRIAVPPRNAARGSEMAALRDFVRLVEATPVLDAKNLHGFRKAVKKARYIAESGGSADGSKTVLKALKRVQDAIGDWHDRLSLTQEAKTALGNDGAELAAWLTIETGRYFSRALTTTGRIREELLNLWRLDASRAIEQRTKERKPGKGPGRKAPSRAVAAVRARSA